MDPVLIELSFQTYLAVFNISTKHLKTYCTTASVDLDFHFKAAQSMSKMLLAGLTSAKCICVLGNRCVSIEENDLKLLGLFKMN